MLLLFYYLASLIPPDSLLVGCVLLLFIESKLDTGRFFFD